MAARDNGMANLQVKSMDDQLYQALSKRAAMENRSISQEVVHIIKSYLARPLQEQNDRSQAFLELCGSWDDERSADDIIHDVRAARRDSSDRFNESL